VDRGGLQAWRRNRRRALDPAGPELLLAAGGHRPPRATGAPDRCTIASSPLSAAGSRFRRRPGFGFPAEFRVAGRRARTSLTNLCAVRTIRTLRVALPMSPVDPRNRDPECLPQGLAYAVWLAYGEKRTRPTEIRARQRDEFGFEGRHSSRRAFIVTRKRARIRSRSTRRWS